MRENAGFSRKATEHLVQARFLRADDGRAHTGLIVAVRITLRHLSVSSATSFAKSPGEPGSAMPLCSESRALILGSAKLALISRLRVSTILDGVFLGAPMPVQTLAS